MFSISNPPIFPREKDPQRCKTFRAPSIKGGETATAVFGIAIILFVLETMGRTYEKIFSMNATMSFANKKIFFASSAAI
jgi:hypothetical protein